MKGSYALVVFLPGEELIQFGRRKHVFKGGYYVYIGSALNGLEQRIRRHLKEEKKLYWHIDYLLVKGLVVDIFYKEGDEREECILAGFLSSNLQGVKGFGCSDCRCRSHLFYGSKRDILSLLEEMGMKRFHINANT